MGCRYRCFACTGAVQPARCILPMLCWGCGASMPCHLFHVPCAVQDDGALEEMFGSVDAPPLPPEAERVFKAAQRIAYVLRR